MLHEPMSGVSREAPRELSKATQQPQHPELPILRERFLYFLQHTPCVVPSADGHEALSREERSVVMRPSHDRSCLLVRLFLPPCLLPFCLLLMLHLGVAVESTRWLVSTDRILTSNKFFDQKSAGDKGRV